MEKEKPQVAKEVAALVLQHYQKLGKSGKPQKGEWTHLAAFCAVWDSGKRTILVPLGLDLPIIFLQGGAFQDKDRKNWHPRLTDERLPVTVPTIYGMLSSPVVQFERSFTLSQHHSSSEKPAKKVPSFRRKASAVDSDGYEMSGRE